MRPTTIMAEPVPRTADLCRLRPFLSRLGGVRRMIFLMPMLAWGTSVAWTASTSLTLAWKPNPEPGVGYRVYYGNATGVYTGKAEAGTNTTLTLTSLDPQRVYYFISCAYFRSNQIESRASNELRIDFAPTIRGPTDQVIDEDALLGLLTITVNDVDTAASTLKLSATSTNALLLPATNITFGGAATHRTLIARPVTNQFGSTLITLHVTDASGLIGDTSFLLTVNPVNDPPELAPVADLVIYQNSGPTNVLLTGMTCGPTNERQSFTVTASLGDRRVVSNLTVRHTPGSGAGKIEFTPNTGATGTVAITATVRDDGGQVRGGIDSFARTFLVVVQPRPSGGFGATNTAPALEVTRGGNTVILVWPSGAQGYVLERADSPHTSSAWVPVTNSPSTSGDRSQVKLPSSGGQAFFRLRRPAE
jgi:hypothetical protein